MAKLKVTLGIGYPGAEHEDVIDVDDSEIEACDTEEAISDLLNEYWQDWANNYIEGGFELIK